MVVKSQTKTKKWKMVLGGIALTILPLLVGGLSVLFTGNQMDSFMSFDKPPLSPPGWLFPVVWTILYVLMGVASVFFFLKGDKDKKTKKVTKITKALRILYVSQLVFNFLWTIFFFGMDAFWLAFAWLVALWLMVIAILVLSYKNYRTSFWCLLPYVLWISFAGYLNLMIAVLN